jgi:YfiH family protein
VVHGIFTRRGGFSEHPYAGLNVSVTTGDNPEHVRLNRAAIAETLALPLVWARPVHGNHIAVIHREFMEDAGQEKPWQERLRSIQADAMVTDQPGFVMLWGFGDCAPVLLTDPRHGAVALVHAGWRGAAAAIVLHAVETMRLRFGTRPAELLAGVGPSIGACCYRVDDHVRAMFAADPFARETAALVERPDEEGDPAIYLDIPETSYRQLRAVGIPRERIEVSGYCTGCRTDLFYSHRREPKPSGRFAAGIGLRATD